VWENEKGKGKANKAGEDWESDERVGDDGYMNLGKLIGASPVRGTTAPTLRRYSEPLADVRRYEYIS
jgi:hypothetical protein